MHVSLHNRSRTGGCDGDPHFQLKFQAKLPHNYLTSSIFLERQVTPPVSVIITRDDLKTHSLEGNALSILINITWSSRKAAT